MAQKAKAELLSKLRDSSDGNRKVLDLTALEAATKLSTEIRKQVQTDVEDARRMPGISLSTEGGDRKALWLPKTLKPDANEVGAFFASAALITNHDVVYYERSDLVLDLSKDQELVADGLLLSLTDNYVNLSNRATGLERGRKMGFAIRIRGFFNSTPGLGPGCLQKNHRWFGNDPPKRGYDKGDKDSFLIKEYFNSLNRDKPEFCMVLGRLAVHFLSLLTEFTHPGASSDEVVESQLKILRAHLRPITEIESRFKRQFITERLVKNKPMKITERRGPRRPHPSSLLIKGEWGLLNSLIHPYWNTLSDLHSHWPERVLELGFDTCENQISDAMMVRWSILEHMSVATTARLNKIRDIIGDPNKKIKKANIDSGHLLEFFKKHEDPVGDFTRFIQNIFKNRAELPDWMKSNTSLTVRDELPDLRERIRMMYRSEKINGLDIEWKQGVLDKPTPPPGFAQVLLQQPPAAQQGPDNKPPGPRTLRAQKRADGVGGN